MTVVHLHLEPSEARGFCTAQCNGRMARGRESLGCCCFETYYVQKSFFLLFRTHNLLEDLVTIQYMELRLQISFQVMVPGPYF